MINRLRLDPPKSSSSTSFKKIGVGSFPDNILISPPTMRQQRLTPRSLSDFELA